MELYIVRHGETLWNKDKRLQGRTDIELADKGRFIAIETGENLRNTVIDRIYSSPLRRAHETAELIRGNRDIEIITDERLRELSFGRFEGQDMRELMRDDSTTFGHFFKRPHLYKAPEDGETLEHLIERASEFMKEIIEPLGKEINPSTKKPFERIMIVAHGALNKAIMSYIKKHSTEFFWSGGLQKNCNVIIVDYTDGKYEIIEETKIFYKEDSSI